MKNKKYTRAQEIIKLKTVTTQLFMNIVQIQQELKRLNPDFKTLVELEIEMQDYKKTKEDDKKDKKDS